MLVIEIFILLPKQFFVKVNNKFLKIVQSKTIHTILALTYFELKLTSVLVTATFLLIM